MSFLESLYRDAVLEHARRPRNHGRLEGATVSQEGLNPSCGDELEVHLLVEEGVVRSAAFTGQGCAISQASASMMTELVRGVPIEEARALVERFKAMIHGGGPHPSLGDAVVLEGISKLHARVKCATLAWVTLDDALDRVGAAADRSAPEAQSAAEAPSPSSSETDE